MFCSDIASFNSVFSLSSFCISFSGSQRPIGSESRLFTGDDSEDKSLLSLSLSLSFSLFFIIIIIIFLIGRIDGPNIWRPYYLVNKVVLWREQQYSGPQNEAMTCFFLRFIFTKWLFGKNYFYQLILLFNIFL